MPSFARLPFRRKLTTAIIGTSGFALLLACATFFVIEYLAFRRDLERNVVTLARVTADNSTAAIAFADPVSAQQTLNALRAEPQIVSAVLHDFDGEAFAWFPAADAAPLAGGISPGVHWVDGRLVCIQEVAEGSRRIGTLRIEATMSAVFARLRMYGAIVLVVLVVAIGVAGAVAAALQQRIVRPVHELIGTARAVASGDDYSLRAREFDRDDLGELTRSFNDMLGKIEAGAEAGRQSTAEIQRLNATLEQRVRERTAQLQEANRELESFSYSVSHDLRAPLRHVQGYAAMLSRSLNGQLPDKARRYLQVIHDASTDMGQLIDDLLAFSRMGRTEMHEAAVDLDILVAEVRRGLELATHDRRIEWQIHAMPAVRGDAAMLRQVLANLIGNAVKFTRTRDPATIAVGCAGHEHDRLIVSVRDNGVGFDMAYYEKLFGVFQRLHTQDEFEGTGIGLANVRRILTRHGGRVWAESTPDHGATFFFTLAPVENPVASTAPS